MLGKDCTEAPTAVQYLLSCVQKLFKNRRPGPQGRGLLLCSLCSFLMHMGKVFSFRASLLSDANDYGIQTMESRMLLTVCGISKGNAHNDLNWYKHMKDNSTFSPYLPFLYS